MFNSSHSERGVQNAMMRKFVEVDEEDEEGGEDQKNEFDREKFKTTKNVMSCFCITEDGKEVFTGEYTGRVFRRKFDRGNFVRHIKAHCPNAVKAMALSKNGRYLFTGGSDMTVKYYHSNDFTLMKTFKVKTVVFSILVYEEDNNTFLFCGTGGGRIYGWNYKNFQPLLPFKETNKQHERIVHCLRLFHDTILSASEDRTVKQWDIKTGKLVSVVNFLYPVTNVMNIRGTFFLFQHFTNCELFTLKKVEKDHSIGKIHREHIFVTITNFTVTSNEKMLVGWNRLIGELEFWDIDKKEKLYNHKIYDAVFLNNIVTVYPPGQPFLLEEQSGMDRRSLQQSRGMGLLTQQMSLATEKDLEKQQLRQKFYVYYIVGKFLDRIEVNRKALMQRREKQQPLPRPAYLGYPGLTKLMTEQYQFPPIVVAQGIQTLVESKRLTSTQQLNDQVNILMEYINQDIQKRSKDPSSHQTPVSDIDMHRKNPELVATRSRYAFSARLTTFLAEAQVDLYPGDANTKAFRKRRRLFYTKLYERTPRKDEKYMLLIRQDKMFEDCVSAYLKSTFLSKMNLTNLYISLAVGQKIEQARRDQFFRLVGQQMMEHVFNTIPAEEGLEGIKNSAYFNADVSKEVFKIFSVVEVYRAAGRILGHCLYHQIRLDFHVASSIFKVLLEKPLDFADLVEVYPSLSLRLNRFLLKKTPEGGKSFWFDDVTKSEIVEGGKEKEVTEEDMFEYVRQFAQHRLVHRVMEYAMAFARGFNEVVPLEYLQIFDEDELEILISGSKFVDINKWRSSCVFSKCDRDSNMVNWLFQTIEKKMKPDQKNMLLHMLTGHYVVPRDGFNPIPMIVRVEKNDLLNSPQSPRIYGGEKRVMEVPFDGNKGPLRANLMSFMEDFEKKASKDGD